MFFSPQNPGVCRPASRGRSLHSTAKKKIHYFLFQSLNSSGNLFQFFANLAAAVNKMGSFFSILVSF